MKYSLLAAILLLTGCAGGFTGVGVAEKLSEQRTQRYTMGVEAHKAVSTSVMEALPKMDRGGMKIKFTEDGKIKELAYSDKLDMDVLIKALAVPHYQEEKVQSILSEIGDFVLKATNMVVPVASIYYGSKNHIATSEAQVLMNQSNNQAQTNMIGSYTGNFNKETTTTDVNNNVSSDVRTTNTANTSTSIVPSVSVTDTGTTVGQ